MSIESAMPSSHLILCRPHLLLPPIPPSIKVFSNESTLRSCGMDQSFSIPCFFLLRDSTGDSTPGINTAIQRQCGSGNWRRTDGRVRSGFSRRQDCCYYAGVYGNYLLRSQRIFRCRWNSANALHHPSCLDCGYDRVYDGKFNSKMVIKMPS